MIDLSVKMLTVKEIAQYVQMGEQTIRRYIQRGQLKAHAFGKEYRVDPADFAAFKESLRGAHQ